MNRRSFFKLLGIGAATSLVIPKSLLENNSTSYPVDGTLLKLTQQADKMKYVTITSPGTGYVSPFSITVVR